MRHLLLLLSPILLTGCALAAGAAGGQMVDYAPDARQRYVETADRPDRIVRALRHRRVVEGMRKREVRLAWGRPTDTEGNAWVYGRKKSDDQTRVYFEDDAVVDVRHGWPE